MAEKRVEYFKLYSPGGTEVEVAGKERAEVLKGRGYTTSKPRNVPRLDRGGDKATGEQSAELEALRAQLAQTEKERDEALRAATEPAKTGNK